MTRRVSKAPVPDLIAALTAAAAPGPATVPGGITALHALDGLFLRGEHLNAIQSYARELAFAVGIGAGTGVVYGYEVNLVLTLPADATWPGTGPWLTVLPGLAVTEIGQPLRAVQPAVVSLAEEDLPVPRGSNPFYVIEVNPASWPFGNEPVYGNLCDDPCAGSAASLAPWTAEGVTVSLRLDDMPGLNQVQDPRHRRSWLASAYFERERSWGGPWLVPGGIKVPVGPLEGHGWATGIGQPKGTGVPIGLIQCDGKEWILDVWAARRDIGGPPADNAWRSRLAMRPWSVFLAQVLQFQDQLADSLGKEMARANRADCAQLLGDLLEETKAMSKITIAKDRSHRYGEIVERFENVRLDISTSTDPKPLWDSGFDELPPAGYLPFRQNRDVLKAWVRDLFPEPIDIRVCDVRADYIAGAVQDSQHLDRIPLGHAALAEVKIDILVPKPHADLAGLDTAAYEWVAFVRRREGCKAEVAPIVYETVEVYFDNDLRDVTDSRTAGVAAERILQDKRNLRVGQIKYPVGPWDFPGEIASRDVLNAMIQKPPSGFSNIVIIAVALADDRQPLAATRAHQFAASLDAGFPPPTVWSVTARADWTTDPAIIVLAQPQPG